MFLLVDLFLLTLNGKFECFEERYIKGMLNIITFFVSDSNPCSRVWEGL